MHVSIGGVGVACRRTPYLLLDCVMLSRMWLLIGFCIGLGLAGCSGTDQVAEGDGWRVLRSEVPEERIPLTGGNLLVALDNAEFKELWSDGHMLGSLPAVDFGSEIVVRADRFSNEDCDRVVFEGIEKLDADSVALTFEPPSGDVCRSFGTSHVVFLAIQRKALPKGPFDLLLGEGIGGLSVEVDI